MHSRLKTKKKKKILLFSGEVGSFPDLYSSHKAVLPMVAPNVLREADDRTET